MTGPSRLPDGWEALADADASLRAELTDLERGGHTTDFAVAGDAIRCGGCGRASRPDAFVASSVIRFEGVSDPDDSAILLAVSCPQCGSRGTIVQAYGPGAGPAGDVVAAVRSAGTR